MYHMHGCYPSGGTCHHCRSNCGRIAGFRSLALGRHRTISPEERTLKQSKVVLASIGAVLVLVAGACGSSSKSKAATGSSATTAAAKASGPPYQVGFDSSLSGTYAANGTGQRSGFTAYIKYVNDHGG